MFVNGTKEVEVLKSTHTQIVKDVAKAIGDMGLYQKSKLTLTSEEEAALFKHFGPVWASYLADSVKRELGITDFGWTTTKFIVPRSSAGTSVVFES